MFFNAATDRREIFGGVLAAEDAQVTRKPSATSAKTKIGE